MYQNIVPADYVEVINMRKMVYKAIIASAFPKITNFFY